MLGASVALESNIPATLGVAKSSKGEACQIGNAQSNMFLEVPPLWILERYCTCKINNIVFLHRIDRSLKTHLFDKMQVVGRETVTLI